jgi:hypothetical protein
MTTENDGSDQSMRLKIADVLMQAPSHIPLAKACTLQEHNAIYKRHGVLWWWKLQTDHSWTDREVREMTVVENRRRVSIHPFRALFDFRYKRSAFLYEMMARLSGKFEKYEFGKPWSELTKDEMDVLAERWPMDDAGARVAETRRAYWVVRQHGIKPDPGWTNFQNISWNLHHNNEALLGAFKQILNSERKRLGKKRNPNEGTVYKRLSWRPIELIDQRQFENKVWSDSERSQVSKAIRSAMRVFDPPGH